jgi:hypothetical protein
MLSDGDIVFGITEVSGQATTGDGRTAIECSTPFGNTDVSG